ncbi:hypothetical protein Mapa_002217 [Marchantia paleacea]|nr:hypothetical protein Mapa_002217 [Marchantia paleacea]
MYESGTRSPEAVMVLRRGSLGVICLFRSFCRVCRIDHRMPEYPWSRGLVLTSIAARVVETGRTLNFLTNNSSVEKTNQLFLELDPLICTSVGGGTEPRCHTVCVSAFPHVVKHPFGALVHSFLRSFCIEHHCHVWTPRNSCHLSYCESNSLNEHLFTFLEPLDQESYAGLSMGYCIP